MTLHHLDTAADQIEQAHALVQLLIATAGDAAQHRPVLHCLGDVIARAGAALDSYQPTANKNWNQQ